MSLILKYDLNNKNRLPAGYTPLAYIESTGTLYIDTGIPATDKTKVHTTILIVTTNDGFIFGSRIAFLNNCFSVHKDYAQFGNNMGLGSSFGTNTKIMNISLSQNGYFLDSKSAIKTYTTQTFTNTNNIFIFTTSLDSGGKYSANAIMKLYRFSILNGDIIQRNLIPCKKSNGTLGMYDTVTETFFGNSGTGSFIAGPEVVNLPYEYQLVEYLESTGGLYINTGWGPTQANLSKVELGVTLSHGTCYHGANNNLNIGGNSDYIRSVGQVSTVAIDPKEKVDFVMYYTDSNRISTFKGTTLTGSNLYTKHNFLIFNLDGADYKSSGKVEYFRAYDNNVMVKNMIPCYRRADLKPGMYDLVTGDFYTNAGTGEFILGPTVEESSRSLEWNLVTKQNYCNKNGLLIKLNDYQNTGSFTLFNNCLTFDPATTVGKKYVITFLARSPNGESNLLIYNNNGNASNIRYFRFDNYTFPEKLSAEWKRYSYTVTNTDRGSSFATTSSNRIEIYAPQKMGVQIYDLSVFEDFDNRIIGLPTKVYYSDNASDFSQSGTIKSTVPALDLYSVSLWVKGKINGNVMLFSLGSSTLNFMTGKYLNTSDGYSNPFYTPGTTTEIAAINPVSWTHVCLVTNSTDSRLYINGIHYGTAKTRKPILAGNLTLARINTEDRYNYTGKIRDFRIYDNALSKEDVEEIYNASKTLSIPALWLPLNYNGGNTNQGSKDVTITTNTATYDSGCYSFDGNTTRIIFNTQPWMQPNTSLSISLVFWIYPITTSYMFASGSFECSISTTLIMFRLGDGSTDYSSNAMIRADHAFSLNTWYHIGFTWEHNTKQIKVYVDKLLIQSLNATPAAYKELRSTMLLLYGSGSYKMKDFRFYDVCIPQQEIEQIYNDTK